MSRFRFVHDHKDTYPVKRLCELAECSRSGYYAWRDRPPSDRAIVDAALTEEIIEIHETSQRTYGAPRVWGQLTHRGWRIGTKRVARLMATEGLGGLSRPKTLAQRQTLERGAGTGSTGAELRRRSVGSGLDGRCHRVRVS